MPGDGKGYHGGKERHSSGRSGGDGWSDKVMGAVMWNTARRLWNGIQGRTVFRRTRKDAARYDGINEMAF